MTSVRWQHSCVATCCLPTASVFLNRIIFPTCSAGLSCRPSARASGTWSTVHFATERCPCSSSSPWWTAPCSWALRGTTRSSMTFRVTCKVRLALAFRQNLFPRLPSSTRVSNSCTERVAMPLKAQCCADLLVTWQMLRWNSETMDEIAVR